MQLVPSSGATSTSLWDVSDAEVLKSWLDEVRRAPTLRTNRPTPGRRSLVAPPLTFSSGTHVQVQAINVDVEHTVYEVQEEFSIGLGEVVRARAAEKARPLPLFRFYQPTSVAATHCPPLACPNLPLLLGFAWQLSEHAGGLSTALLQRCFALRACRVVAC